jgi:hypothetical protein
MPADYFIITNDPFTFHYPGSGEMDKSYEFTLPARAKVDSNSILFWFAELGMQTGYHFSCRININTKQVYEQSFAMRSTGSYHAVIGANILKQADKTNNIEFEIVGSGSATLRVSNICLMVQI